MQAEMTAAGVRPNCELVSRPGPQALLAMYATDHRVYVYAAFASLHLFLALLGFAGSTCWLVRLSKGESWRAVLRHCRG